MPFAAAVSSHPLTVQATGEIVGQVIDRIGAHPDVALVAVSAHHAGALEDVAAAVRTLLQPTVLVGWVASDVAGDLTERARPGVGLWAGLTGPVAPLRLAQLGPAPASTPPPPFEARGMVVIGAAPPASGHPPGPGVPRWVPRGLPVAGALSDVAHSPIVLDDTSHRSGAVGVVLGPGVELSVSVEDGRRAIGDPQTVTAVEGPLLVSLGGRRAMDALIGVARDQVPAGDVALINRSLHLMAASAGRDRAHHAVRGRDAATGALVVEPALAVGDLVQFNVFDPRHARRRAQRIVDGPGGGALAWRVDPGPAGRAGSAGGAGAAVSPLDPDGPRPAPDSPLLACAAATVFGAADGSGVAGETIAVGLFRQVPGIGSC